MADEQRIAFGVAILAAGASSRMGRPKMLLSWGKTSVLGHLLNVWQSLGAKQITVVCDTKNLEMQTELTRLHFPESSRIANPAPERGMFSSIQCAARWSHWQPGLTHWMIVLGDQPHLSTHTLRIFVDGTAREPAKICQPAYRGHAGHPVALPAAAFKELSRTTAQTLNQFLQTAAFERSLIEIEDPGLELDLDTPEDYERARQKYVQS